MDSELVKNSQDQLLIYAEFCQVQSPVLCIGEKMIRREQSAHLSLFTIELSPPSLPVIPVNRQWLHLSAEVTPIVIHIYIRNFASGF